MFVLFKQVNVDYTEKTVSISNYPLSAALTCAKICSAFEEVWGVLWQTDFELIVDKQDLLRVWMRS